MIHAIIGTEDNKVQWKEEFLDINTEKELQEIINNFNNTLRPGERKRKLVKILKTNIEPKTNDLNYIRYVLFRFAQEIRIERTYLQISCQRIKFLDSAPRSSLPEKEPVYNEKPAQSQPDKINPFSDPFIDDFTSGPEGIF